MTVKNLMMDGYHRISDPTCKQCNKVYRFDGFDSVKLCPICREDPLILRAEIRRLDFLRFEAECTIDRLQQEATDQRRHQLLSYSAK